jgi:putative FmdB family regulatory protein
MPTYTYVCEDCKHKQEIFFSIKEYKEKTKCEKCGKICIRSYADDLITTNSFVRLADSEIKTLGHLAYRNTEKMSDDQKRELHNKHNSYKHETPKELPTGMTRLNKGTKTIWPK